MNLLIIGAGAQAKYAVEIAKTKPNINIMGILDVFNNPEIAGKDFGGVSVEGGMDKLETFQPSSDMRLIVAVSDNRKKEDIVYTLLERGYSFTELIHPSATIASTARIGVGVLVNPTAVIQPFAVIGNHVMIHAGCIIEHDCIVEDFSNLAPRTTISGWVKVGKRAKLYTGCSVIPGKSIGDDAIVGAGAVVIDDVPSGKTVAGVPAHCIGE
ncbi:MAG: acetyltransferase [Candidatus Latescibacteria bacterium]|mgnify:CR=1 FL=1|jgi:acetyltransferase EpsM|nr:acetyltransferase [Candidatus Latescibacterota bacterium]